MVGLTNNECEKDTERSSCGLIKCTIMEGQKNHGKKHQSRQKVFWPILELGTSMI